MSARADRLMVWQAQEMYPAATFAPLQGQLVHAIRGRLAPTLLCETMCGRLQYAKAATVLVDDAAPVCIQCVGVLGRTEERAE